MPRSLSSPTGRSPEHDRRSRSRRHTARRLVVTTTAAVLATALALPIAGAGGAPPSTTRVSVSMDGAPLDGRTFAPSMSSDGRFVVFASGATNLVPGDTNGATDVFLHDRGTGQTERVSLAHDGSEGNAGSGGGAVSDDGRFVAFSSSATNLVPGGATNDSQDVYVRDRLLGTTERVSVSSAGVEANGVSTAATLSADGRVVAFASDATNLVPGDTNGVRDVFVHDLTTGQTERVSVSSNGDQANGTSHRPALSANGRYVAFDSEATDLVEGDTNGERDVFVHDRATGRTERVSLAGDGSEGNDTSSTPAISPSGRHVAFASGASNLVPGDGNGVWDVFVRDRKDGTTERVSVATDGTEADDWSYAPSIGAGGRFVSFQTAATNLAPGVVGTHNDIFLHDRRAGTTELVSVAVGGTSGDDVSERPVTTPRGRFVAFVSFSSDLVAGDADASGGTFLRDRGPQCATGFDDVPPQHQFCAEIEWLVDAGITTGFADGTFRPTDQLSRMAMAAFLYRASGEPAVTLPDTPTFSDVGDGHPFRTEIEWLVDAGITTGFADGTFRPAGQLSRMAMAAFLHRWQGEPAVAVPSPATFADVGSEHPFVVPVEWLVLESVTTGFADGTFRPTSPLTRQAMAAFLERAEEIVPAG